jgi:hypothetical protein
MLALTSPETIGSVAFARGVERGQWNMGRHGPISHSIVPIRLCPEEGKDRLSDVWELALRAYRIGAVRL